MLLDRCALLRHECNECVLWHFTADGPQLRPPALAVTRWRAITVQRVSASMETVHDVRETHPTRGHDGDDVVDACVWCNNNDPAGRPPHGCRRRVVLVRSARMTPCLLAVSRSDSNLDEIAVALGILRPPRVTDCEWRSAADFPLRQASRAASTVLSGVVAVLLLSAVPSATARISRAPRSVSSKPAGAGRLSPRVRRSESTNTTRRSQLLCAQPR